MRLYLSSYRIGAHGDRLLTLGFGRRTALIPNALDGLPADVRDAGLQRDVADLGQLGLDVAELDLRDPDAGERLSGFDIVWVRGGNTFVLRRVLADTGTDRALTGLVQRDAILYAGYSAGACVLAPDLSGLEAVDDIAAVTDPVTTGLGWLDRPFVPHVRSPGHPETAACDVVAARYQAAGQAHWALRDGDVLIIDGDTHAAATVRVSHAMTSHPAACRRRSWPPYGLPSSRAPWSRYTRLVHPRRVKEDVPAGARQRTPRPPDHPGTRCGTRHRRCSPQA